MYEVSRKTIYKWLEQSMTKPAPLGSPIATALRLHFPGKLSDGIIPAHIVAARHRWHWGPRKLRVKLAAAHPDIDVARRIRHEGRSAEASAGSRIAANRACARRRMRSRCASVEQANHTWCADFKAGSAPPTGTRCDPLTITDAHSRYLLRCHIVPKADTPHVAAIFDAAFHQHGLPRVIPTDNGVPFASRAPGRPQPQCRCDG